MSYVEIGSFGAVEPSAVKSLQATMISKGFLTGNADGIVGPKTFGAAVKLAKAVATMLETVLPGVKARLPDVASTLTKRLKDARATIDSAAVSKNITALASAHRALAAMFSQAAGIVQSPISADTKAFLALDLTVLGTSPVAPATVTQSPATTTAITPAVIVTGGGFLSNIPVVPVLGALAVLGAIGASMMGGKRKNPGRPRRRVRRMQRLVRRA